MNRNMNEEQKVIREENRSTEVLTAYNKIPYALLNAELEGTTKDTLNELTQICGYYQVYKEGKDFTVEGTNGDYVPAKLRYKMAASLINKEARFLFAEQPDIVVDAKGDLTKVDKDIEDALTVMKDLIDTVLDDNHFEESILKAAKDCFIGKRVAGLVNFNEEDGITLTFLPSTQFIYETRVGNPNVLTKFVCFMIVKDSITLSEKRIFKKKYELEDDVVYLEEEMYDGAGRIVDEIITERQPIELDRIPAAIFINDGLTGEEKGESEIELLQGYEMWYSKLSNGDIDAERKSMNPIRYSVDMDNRSTKNLSSSAGSFWDLQSDQNLDHSNPSVGMLESSMGYSDSLKTSLDRMKTTSYEQVDIPNITLESMQGAITSGKALKAIYWPLIVRCKEKMKMWGPQLRTLMSIIIDGAMAYPNVASHHITNSIIPIDYEIKVIQNLPLPEDEQEEKNMDLAEVESQVMSKKSYMKKWRSLTDDEANDELEQIAYERQILEDMAFPDDGLDEGLEDEGMMDDNFQSDNIEEGLEDESDDLEDNEESDPEIDSMITEIEEIIRELEEN